ncbi:hypothetical protein [Actinopolymorpha rutila]|uniref:non-reducing end alpha-L-arabinofuranosidase n=1 Tax=Actinopolymorpha rutila TaxID=446787 RepID=A0A852ZH76_9ACTN|nr:hypothetical protein [Actinopolymorpha rutila]NYH92437.1 alpha-N-arabinofuranosidase [Actinopolymorpha rutila]
MRYRRPQWRNALILLSAASCALALTPAPSFADDVPVVLQVKTNQRIGSASPFLAGANNDQFWNNSHGLWDPAANAPDPAVVDKTRRANIGMVRFPGGTPAALYDWKSAIGPANQRACQTPGQPNGGPGPVDGSFGPDEYMKFVEATGARPDIMTPMINETPSDAADWVEYMNAPLGTNPRGGTAWAQIRAENGHPAPYGVRSWEIGNEPDRSAQTYWRSTDPTTNLREYAFGGTEPQVGQNLQRGCDRRPAASKSDGRANQQLKVYYPPVVPDSQTIYVGGTAWTAVADLGSAGPSDRVYEFDPKTGTVHFGDGIHGAVPAKQAVVTADYTPERKPGFVDFYAEMKKADPSIDVCATWAPINKESGLGVASFAQVMRQSGLADNYDCLVVHPYTNFRNVFGDGDWKTAQEGHDEYFLGEKQATDLVANLISDVRTNGSGRQYVATSEYGALWFGAMNDISAYPHWDTAMSHALYMASQWTAFSQLNLPWAMGNTLIGDTPTTLRSVLGGLPDLVYTADAVMREQFKPLVDGGGTTVATTVRNNPQVTPEATEDARFGTYGALATTAAVGDDGVLRVAVVNRDAGRAVTAEVVPAGYAHGDLAAVSTVAGQEFTSYNSVGDPDAVQIQRGRMSLGSTAFRYTFPAHSTTIIELHPAR